MTNSDGTDFTKDILGETERVASYVRTNDV